MPRFSRCQRHGWVAEWLCSGLQLRVRRFDSDPSLQVCSHAWFQVALAETPELGCDSHIRSAPGCLASASCCGWYPSGIVRSRNSTQASVAGEGRSENCPSKISSAESSEYIPLSTLGQMGASSRRTTRTTLKGMTSTPSAEATAARWCPSWTTQRQQSLAAWVRQRTVAATSPVRESLRR
jgi:hypothetical protein